MHRDYQYVGYIYNGINYSELTSIAISLPTSFQVYIGGGQAGEEYLGVMASFTMYSMAGS